MLGVFWWAGFLIAKQWSDSLVFADLASHAARIQVVFGELPASVDPADAASVAEQRLSPDFADPASGYFYRVSRRHDGADILSPSLADHAPDVPQMVPGESRRGRAQIAEAHTALYWSGGYRRDGVVMQVTVLRDVSAIYRQLELAAWLALVASLSLLLVATAVQHWIVRRTTSQLDAIRADVERLGHGEIVALREQVPAEVLPLVVEFNQLLERFDQRLRQSRNALGNLAHALKGPLNLMIRAADDNPDGPAVRQNAERIRQLIDGELRRARLVGRTSAGRRFDLAAEVRSLSGLLAQVYTDKTVEVRLAEGAGVNIVHDRQDMLELIGNLLDNAVKWADSLVMVNVRGTDGLLIEIEDDGPGASEEALLVLTERGVRLDETVAGHGLGLAIVKDIVRTYGGELELGRSVRLGGMRVSVSLPERDSGRRS